MRNDELRQVLFKLSQFDPACTDIYGHNLLDYLVLDALAVFGPLLLVSSTEVRENISQTFLLDYEDAEIDASAERLSKTNKVTFIKRKTDQEKPRYQILESTAETIRENIDNLKTVEEKSIESWRNLLLKKYKEYSEITENIDLIVDALYDFISKMFIRHGVECVALIYPDDEKTGQWLSEIKGSILEELPRINPFTDSILKLEIPNFFRNPGPGRQQYISSIFNSSFFWHLSQVDHSCSRLLREVTSGQRLYLDNNIIYNLVGLDGPNYLKSAHSLLRLANELGYEIWVTTKTIDEFHNSLLWQIEELQKPFPLPKELARIGTESLGEDNLITTYWNEYLESSTSLEDFYAEKSNLDQIITGLQIQTTDAFREEIENSAEFNNECGVLRSVAGYANEHIIEHDAFHRVFINRVRMGPRNHFSEAIAWFLTNDSKLPVFDRVARKGQHHLPFCITSSQWIQVNRPLLARTKDPEAYESSFHILVTQPFVRSMLAPLSMEKAYHEVLGRLARYKAMKPEFARNIVANKHFMVSVATEDNVEQVDELVENEIINLANYLQVEKEELEDENLESLSRIEELTQRVEALEESKKSSNDQVIEYQQQLLTLNDDLGQEIKRRKDAEEITQVEAERLSSYKRYVRNTILFLILLTVGSCIIWFQPFFFACPWLDGHKNQILIKISAQIILVFMLLPIFWKDHWKWFFGIAMATLIGLIAIAAT